MHYIDQGSVLHVHAFRTTHVWVTFLCTTWVAFFFIVFPFTYHFFLVYGVHCFGASMCTAFVIVLCCRCTHFALRASFFVPKSMYCTSCTHIVNFLVRIWRTAHKKWFVDYNFLEYYYLMICGFVHGNCCSQSTPSFFVPFSLVT